MGSKPTRERAARGASALDAATAMCGIGYLAEQVELELKTPW